jgi:xylan 1,4-beta-xylosidase
MPIELKAHASAAGTPLKHFWNVCVGAGRANERLRAGWQRRRIGSEHLK